MQRRMPPGSDSFRHVTRVVSIIPYLKSEEKIKRGPLGYLSIGTHKYNDNEVEAARMSQDIKFT